jgi:hypothetical protein
MSPIAALKSQSEQNRRVIGKSKILERGRAAKLPSVIKNTRLPEPCPGWHGFLFVLEGESEIYAGVGSD